MSRLWVGIALAPLAWVAGFAMNYELVPFACQSRHVWLLHLIWLATFAAASFGLASAHAGWVAAGRGWPGEGASAESRNRFLGLFGMVFSAAMMLVTVAQWLPVFFLDPCTIG